MSHVPGLETTHEPRDFKHERDTLYEAARGLVDPTPLYEHSLARAAAGHKYGPGDHIRVGKDWLLEGRAEGADWANYLRWWLKNNHDHPQAPAVFLALSLITQAYTLTLPLLD